MLGYTHGELGTGPGCMSGEERFEPLLGGWTPQPIADGIRIDMYEEALAELLDRGQPVGVQTERSAIDGEADILKVAVNRSRRGLEARKTIEAHDLAEAMHSDEILDETKVEACARRPCGAGQGFCKKSSI